MFKANEKGSGKKGGYQEIAHLQDSQTTHSSTRDSCAPIPARSSRDPCCLWDGYGQQEHFECMSLELLGPSIAEMQKGNAGAMAKTVLQVVGQVVRRIRIQAS